MGKDKCVQFLVSGVEFKRAGNYIKALEQYKFARLEDPSNRNVYYNPAKLLFGLGKYDEALKYFLAYSHVLILTNTHRDPMEDMIRQQTVDSLIRIDRSITKRFELPPDWLAKIISDTRFIKSLVDINCNQYVGMCLSANSKEFNLKNGITDAHILDIRNAVLGKRQVGVVLNAKQEHTLMSIGLYFTWRNLDLTICDIADINIIYLQKPPSFSISLD